jgi:hypothetical protein
MPTVQLLLIAFLFRFLAQDAGPTNLAITGAESAVFTNSDTNACFLQDDNSLSAQLTDPSSEMILSLNVLATVGDHPAKNQLQGLTLDGPAEDPFVSWTGVSGTVTLDDLAAMVPIEGGDASIAASTRGVLGHINADLTSKQGSIHVSGPFACHSPL